MARCDLHKSKCTKCYHSQMYFPIICSPSVFVETPFEKRIVTLIYKRKFSKVPFKKADAPSRKSFSESLFLKITLKRVRFFQQNKRVVVGCVL